MHSILSSLICLVCWTSATITSVAKSCQQWRIYCWMKGLSALKSNWLTLFKMLDLTSFKPTNHAGTISSFHFYFSISRAIVFYSFYLSVSFLCIVNKSAFEEPILSFCSFPICFGRLQTNNPFTSLQFLWDFEKKCVSLLDKMAQLKLRLSNCTE